jgi:hypothetical protein
VIAAVTYDDIVDDRCNAWNIFATDLEAIAFITLVLGQKSVERAVGTIHTKHCQGIDSCEPNAREVCISRNVPHSS